MILECLDGLAVSRIVGPVFPNNLGLYLAVVWVTFCSTQDFKLHALNTVGTYKKAVCTDERWMGLFRGVIGARLKRIVLGLFRFAHGAEGLDEKGGYAVGWRVSPWSST